MAKASGKRRRAKAKRKASSDRPVLIRGKEVAETAGANTGAGASPKAVGIAESRWQALVARVNSDIATLSNIPDYDSYVRVCDAKQNTVDIFTDADGSIEKITKGKLISKKMSQSEFRSRINKLIQDRLGRFVKDLTLMLEYMEGKLKPSPIPDDISLGYSGEEERYFLLYMNNLEILLSMFPGVPDLPVEKYSLLVIKAAHFLENNQGLNLQLFKQLQETISSFPAMTLSGIAALFNRLALQAYTMVLSRGKALFSDEEQERCHAIELIMLLNCRIMLEKSRSDENPKSAFLYAIYGTINFIGYCDNDRVAEELKKALAGLREYLAAMPVGQPYTADISSLIKLIHIFPPVLGVTPHEYAERYIDDSFKRWLMQGPSRIDACHERLEGNRAYTAELQREYIERCIEAARQKARNQEMLRLRLSRLTETAASSDTDEEREETKGSATDEVTLADETPRMFPYIQAEYETQCCTLHAHIMGLSAEVRRRIARAIKTPPPDFTSVNALLDEMAAEIELIPDHDNNHKAQKKIFIMGMYLQALHGHLPFIQSLESQLVELNKFTGLAMDAVLSLQESTDGMADGYANILTRLVSEVEQAEQEYMVAVDRVFRRNQEKKDRAAERRGMIGASGGYKPRNQWHVASRTAETIKALGLVAGSGSSNPALFGTASMKQRPVIVKKVSAANTMLTGAGVVTASATHMSTTEPMMLLSEMPQHFVDESGNPKELELDAPEFISIMSAIENNICVNIARRMRLHGGAIRDYLLSPSESPNDWDFDFFGTYQEFVDLLPEAYKASVFNCVMHIDKSGKPVMRAEFSFFIDDKEYPIDITFIPCLYSEFDAKRKQPSSADITANGLYTYKKRNGKHIILNHQGSSRARDVMDSLLAPVSRASYVTLEQDPLLILRALRFIGQYKLGISDDLLAELKRVGESFSLSKYSVPVQEHFKHVFARYRDDIMGVEILQELPALQAAFEDLHDDSLGVCAFKSLGM
ncbi:MAG: hypothetical protein P1U40_07110 [Coxiellaceae bacterium]|nr:hypothetical protein [Coxiellaceae bacterium]